MTDSLFSNIPIVLDPSMPPDRIELHFPSGAVRLTFGAPRMKLPWRRLSTFGLGLIDRAFPALDLATDVVEQLMPGEKGDKKQAAAIAVAQTAMTAAGVVDVALLRFPNVLAALKNLIDAIVKLKNEIAVAKQQAEAEGLLGQRVPER